METCDVVLKLLSLWTKSYGVTIVLQGTVCFGGLKKMKFSIFLNFCFGHY